MIPSLETFLKHGDRKLFADDTLLDFIWICMRCYNAFHQIVRWTINTISKKLFRYCSANEHVSSHRLMQWWSFQFSVFGRLIIMGLPEINWNSVSLLPRLTVTKMSFQIQSYLCVHKELPRRQSPEQIMGCFLKRNRHIFSRWNKMMSQKVCRTHK